MDTLTFISKLIEFTAWPLAAVGLIALLRSEIRTLLPHVKKLKAGPVEAEFERSVKELQAEAGPKLNLLAMNNDLPPDQRMLLQLVEVNPRSAILEAWRGIEEAALRVVKNKALYVSEKEARSQFAVIRTLGKESILTQEYFALYHDLRALRNQAAHATEFGPSAEAALSYLELAGRLKNALEVAAK